jgi:hypothetical protein
MNRASYISQPVVRHARVLATIATALCLVVSSPASAGPGHSITTTVESGEGKIKPSSPTVADGGSKTIKMKPAKGWHVAEVTVDGNAAVYDKDSALIGQAVTLKRKMLKYKLSSVSADQSVSVRFEQDRTFELSVSVAGAGTVKVRPGGIKKCGPGPDTCTGAYKEDKTAKLKAKPAKGHVFAGWSGSTSGLSKNLKITINGDKAVTATFVAESAPASSLRVADKISVVDPKNAGAGQPAALVAAADLPADSDYEQDETFVFVEERSVEAFDTINEILCMAGQTQYDDMLNQGPYKALVDEKQCSNEKDDASSADGEGSQASGAARPEYMQWTVDSARAGHGAPHVVKVWVREDSDDPFEPSQLIFAKMVITESASASNPYGIFNLDFEAHPLGDHPAGPAAAMDASGEPLFRGYMRTERSPSGDVLLKFISASTEGLPGEFTEKATLNKSATGGRGTTWVRDAFGPFVEESRYNIAFDDAHFLRDDGDDARCLDRNDFDETAWRYGLYDSETGSRINPQSGFPVKVVRDGVEYHGWVGYWGVWFPEDVSLENGDTVYRQEFDHGSDGATETPYELFIAEGKLRKHTKRTLLLGDIKNIPLDSWEDSTQTQSRVVWNGTSFSKVSRFDEEQHTWAQLDPAQPLDLSNLPYDTMFFWSQGLGGNVRVKLACTDSYEANSVSFSCTANDASEVVIFAETVIYPGDAVPATLSCLTECPNGANDGSQDLFFDTSALEYQETPPASATTIPYTFDGDSMLLMSGATPIVQTVDNEYQPWGVRSGPLFEPTPANVAALACDWDQSGNTTCGWQAWDRLDEYYVWESGPFEWNRLSALRNQQDQLERFEPPLSVEYTHAQPDEAARDHKYDGTAFYLDYNGFGDLHGIPGTCVDFETGDGVSCGPNTRWIPELTIPDGSELDGDAATYLSRALEKEQRMREVDASACSGLHLVTYELPSIDSWAAPGIGPEPQVDGAPAVVGGVIQN